MFFRKPFDPEASTSCADELLGKDAMTESLTTGDAGLDHVLGGGLPAGSLIIVAGPPGSGKTILAQQVCFANATPERKAVYYTTWSEPHDKLVRHLEPFAFFDVDALGDRVEFLHLAELIGGGGTDGLGAAADEILRRSFETKPAIIVIDSSKALHDVVGADELSARDLRPREQGRLQQRRAASSSASTPPAETRAQPEFAVADGIVQLENEAHGPIDRRWLRVLKMRGAGVAAGQHSFRIGDGRASRCSRGSRRRCPRRCRRSTGRAAFDVEKLDDAIGGGIPRGDSTLLIGPSGVGKTLLALQLHRGRARRRERAVSTSRSRRPPTQVREKAAVGRAGTGRTCREDRLDRPPDPAGRARPRRGRRARPQTSSRAAT